MSFLKRLLTRRSDRPDHDNYEWKNNELGIYFTVKPEDRAWKAYTAPVADLVQSGFLEVYRRAGLERFDSTNNLPQKVIDLIAEVSNEVAEPQQMNPAFIILVAHQYVDADKMKRQMWRTRWVALMMSRDTCAPPPESYIEYIGSTYFADRK